MTRPDIKDEDIIADYLAGMSFRKLAAKYGIGTKSIQYRLKRNNIEQRVGSLSKLSLCVICGATFEQDVWERKKTCSRSCKKILIQISLGTFHKQTVEYKYPWGSYIYKALSSICDMAIERKGKIIPYSLISTLFRLNFGVKLVDPTLKSAIVDYLSRKGYEFEKTRFIRRKVRVPVQPEGQMPE